MEIARACVMPRVVMPLRASVQGRDIQRSFGRAHPCASCGI